MESGEIFVDDTLHRYDEEMKKVAVIVTNFSQYPSLDRKTGLWLGEVTHFCDELEKQGFGFDLISPQGGECPLDPKSLGDDLIDEKFMARNEFRSSLRQTKSAAEVKAQDYAAIYFSGGHGTMWDFPESKSLQALASLIFQSGGVISAVCHGVCGLLNVQDAAGKNIVAKISITGFSNLEEMLVRLTKHVPFSLEDELKKRSAVYKKAFLPFVSFVIQHDRIVTGQNPASARAVGKKVADLLAG